MLKPKFTYLNDNIVKPRGAKRNYSELSPLSQETAKKGRTSATRKKSTVPDKDP